MALHKTDYGLVYNDDGSLCVTKRTDDVPFPGTTAWAVEEGTTNILQQNKNAYVLWGVEYTELSPFGFKAILDGDTDNWYYVRWDLNLETGTYVIHFIADGSEMIQGYFRLCIGKVSGGNYPQDYLPTQMVVNPTTQNEKRTFTFTVTDNTDATRIVFFKTHNGGGTIYIKQLQLEEKPFATSFVEGTRPTGKLSKPVSKNENMVIAGWVKCYAPSTAQWKRIFSFEDTTDSNRIACGIDPLQTTPYFFVNTKYNGVSYTTDGTIEVLPNEWYFIVFILDNGVYSLKSIGPNFSQIETIQSIRSDMINKTFDSLNIGYRTKTGQDFLHGFISNIYIGKYRDDQDNIIWTDEYITSNCTLIVI